MSAVTASETTGAVGGGGSLRSFRASAPFSWRSRSEARTASTLKRRPRGKNRVQIVSAVRTTVPPFSSMMFRLLMLTSRSATKRCIKRVRQPMMNDRQSKRCSAIRNRTSSGLENAR
jgi:hypothetical protein